MRIQILLGLLVALVGAAGAETARATVITAATPMDFSASDATVTFDGMADGDFPLSYTEDGATFTRPDGLSLTPTPGGGGLYLSGPVQVSFGAGISRFGWTLDFPPNTSGTIRFELFANADATGLLGSYDAVFDPGMVGYFYFLGVTSSDPFRAIRISDPFSAGFGYAMDPVVFGPLAGVPEPTTTGLAAAALALAAASRRRAC